MLDRQEEAPADPDKGFLFLSPSTGMRFSLSGFARFVKKRVAAKTGVEVTPNRLRCGCVVEFRVALRASAMR